MDTVGDGGPGTGGAGASGRRGTSTGGGRTTTRGGMEGRRGAEGSGGGRTEEGRGRTEEGRGRQKKKREMSWGGEGTEEWEEKVQRLWKEQELELEGKASSLKAAEVVKETRVCWGCTSWKIVCVHPR